MIFRWRRAAFLAVAMAAPFAYSADLPKSRSVLDRLKPERLDAVRQQRIEWMKTRQVDPPHGVYNEYRVVARPCGIGADSLVKAAAADGVHGLVCTDGRLPASNGNSGLQVLGPEGLKLPPAAGLTEVLKSAGLDPGKWKRLASALTNYPDEFLGAGELPVEVNPVAAALVAGKKAAETIWKPALRNSSLRVFAREPGEIQQALAEGRFNSARDWLCDPSGFYFWASSNLGVYNVGDTIPMQRAVRIEARSPVAAVFRLFQDDKLIHESEGKEFKHAAPAAGSYRMEALLRVDGEERPWISTGTIRASSAAPNIALPSYKIDESVEQIKDIAYVENGDAKQKLDVYLPKGKRDFPVFVFVHGGSWSSGDKSIYVPIGNLFARMGIGVVIPSYRLMPAHKHPAQVEDAAAAWAWAVKNMAIQYGADPQRLYLGGHSAGGHLASLLALDPRYLEKHGVTSATIKGVAALSGVYDMRVLPMFGSSVDERKQASPVEFVRKDAPPFVVSYCQWDYFFLPLQAKEFAAKLKENFVSTKLVYVPGQSHISEVIAMLSAGDPTTAAIVEMIGAPAGAAAAN